MAAGYAAEATRPWLDVDELVDARDVVRAWAAVDPAARGRGARRPRPLRRHVKVVVIQAPLAALGHRDLVRYVLPHGVAQDLTHDGRHAGRVDELPPRLCGHVAAAAPQRLLVPAGDRRVDILTPLAV